MRKVFLVIVLLIALLPTLAHADSPDKVMGDMFAKHPDFACVSLLPNFTGARNPTIDAFAQDRKLDANKVQCYFYTWVFDRDSNATNPFGAKGHYYRAGRLTITDQDHAVMAYRDVDSVIESLGYQSPFIINDRTDRPVHQWLRYANPAQVIPE